MRALVPPAARLGRGPGVRAWLGAIVLRNLRGTAAGIVRGRSGLRTLMGAHTRPRAGGPAHTGGQPAAC
ncbi:hypothetical protein GCM10022255_112830 [Dactylosporangium darangshiense]|uniref:Uncharacterized protein n=1 Tax=Dactylosporangium darangshiense TaxID=579108 RepID=A0ABP8DV96_9ACTN